jgi:hypothetical protein
MIIQVVAKTIKPLFVRSIPQLLFISSAMLAAALLQTMTYGSHQQGNSKTTRQEFSS